MHRCEDLTPHEDPQANESKGYGFMVHKLYHKWPSFEGRVDCIQFNIEFIMSH